MYTMNEETYMRQESYYNKVKMKILLHSKCFFHLTP